MIDETSRVRRSPAVAAHALGGDGGVLLHLTTGRYHGLDAVGWAIWGLLDGRRSIAQVTEALRAQFPDAPAELPRDVAEFVRALAARDLVEVDTRRMP